MAAPDSYVPNLYTDVLTSPGATVGKTHSDIARNVSSIAPVLTEILLLIGTTYWIYGYSSGPALSPGKRILVGVVMAASVMFSHAKSRGRVIPNLFWIHETECALRSGTRAQFVLLCLTLLLSRHLPVWGYALSLVTVVSSMLLIRRIASELRELCESDEQSVTPWHVHLLKRTMDITIASSLLILAIPVLLLIALFVKLDSSGPVLFVQRRVGRNGALFRMYKFRSMHRSVPPYAVSPTRSSDARITRVGRILRRSGIDELPQLFNVLRGDMSLVGPRPEMPFMVERHIEQHRARLLATPGITGLWQLSRDRAFPIHQNPHHDQFYIQNRTFFMDVAILLHTPLFAMRGGV